MDGDNNGSKPYEQMDDLGGGKPPIFGSTPIDSFQDFPLPFTLLCQNSSLRAKSSWDVDRQGIIKLTSFFFGFKSQSIQ